MKKWTKAVTFTSCFFLVHPLIAENYNSLAISADLVGYQNKPFQQETSSVDKSFIGITSSFNEINGEIDGSKDFEVLPIKWGEKPGYQFGFSYITPEGNLDCSYLQVKVPGNYYVENGPSTISFFSKKPENIIEKLLTECPSITLLQNLELNYTAVLTPPKNDIFSSGWIFGIRGVQLHEHVGTTFSDENKNKKVYRMSTNNNIGALQIGGVVTWNPTRMLQWDFISKIGMGCNFNSKQTQWGILESSGASQFKSDKVKNTNFPFLADGRIRLLYQPSEFLHYHASYHVMYLKGIASAISQLPPDKDQEGGIKQTPVIGNSSFFSYGYTFGIVLNF